ncbi:hypothetical protein NXH76_03165 [Blautia schinkii]|nr:hypothetical protein [Blautia schinkii]
MNVRFIDTSIIMNLLEIPYMCDKKDEVKEEFRNAIENGERLVLPISVIIESGNHIAHIADGNMRKEKAESFSRFLEKTAKDDAPWKLFGTGLDKEDLLHIAEDFPEKALTMRMGVGDLSIIRLYNNFIENTPALGRIMIWSTDSHLQGYSKDVSMKRRRDR